MSELLLFEALAQEHNGQHYKAINVITKKEKHITNLISKLESLSRNYEKLEKNEKAVDVLNQLLQISSANAECYWRILKLKGIDKPKHANDLLSETE